MSRIWSISEMWDQLSARVRTASQPAITPQTVLLAITLAMIGLSIAMESLLLFLLAVGQGVAILHLLSSPRSRADEESSESPTTMFAGVRERLPTMEAVQRVGWQVGTVLYRVLYRSLMCLVVSLAAGMATLSAFVLNQAELWQWRTLQTAGPPLGAVLVTGLVTMLVLLMSGWIASRRPLLPR